MSRGLRDGSETECGDRVLACCSWYVGLTRAFRIRTVVARKNVPWGRLSNMINIGSV
jgi:hypothetical protein